MDVRLDHCYWHDFEFFLLSWVLMTRQIQINIQQEIKTSFRISYYWSRGNAFFSGVGDQGSNLGPVKLNIVLPTVCRRGDSSSKNIARGYAFAAVTRRNGNAAAIWRKFFSKFRTNSKSFSFGTELASEFAWRPKKKGLHSDSEVS